MGISGSVQALHYASQYGCCMDVTSPSQAPYTYMVESIFDGCGSLFAPSISGEICCCSEQMSIRKSFSLSTLITTHTFVESVFRKLSLQLQFKYRVVSTSIKFMLISINFYLAFLFNQACFWQYLNMYTFKYAPTTMS